MISSKLNELIADAMKNHENEKLTVFRLIKSEFTKAEKDGVVLDDVSETKILLKMASQREDSIKQYLEGGRIDLSESEKKELEIINEFTPKQPTEEEIEDYTRGVITSYKLTKDSGYRLSMKDMKPILSIVQQKYPSVNGKIVSKTLNNVLNS